MIDRTHPLTIKHQAEIANISRSSVYYESAPISDAELKQVRRIDRTRRSSPRPSKK